MRPAPPDAGSAPGAELEPPHPRPAPAPSRPLWRWARRIVSVGLIVGGLVAAYGRRHDIHQAVDGIGDPAWGWLLAACVTQASSMVAFARLQRWLLRSGGIRVRLRDMVEITLAGNAMSTSLPGGAAWAAGWVWGQLRRRQVDRVLAGWVVLVAGALASFALFLIVVIGSFIAGSHGPATSLRWVGSGLLVVGVLATIAIIAVVRSARLGQRWQARVALAADHHGRRDAVIRAADRFSDQVRVVTPTRLAWVEALGLALYNWIADLLTLVFAVWAVHGHVPWRGIVVAYALTQISASIPITPGGLAVVEASLTALLTAYGMPATEAITVVLFYRLVSFWALVPIGWGSWAYLELAQRRPGGDRTTRRHHPWAEHRHLRRSGRGVGLPAGGAGAVSGMGFVSGPGSASGLDRGTFPTPGLAAGRRPALVDLDSRRGPEHLRRPQACEGCEQTDDGDAGLADAGGLAGTEGVAGAVGVPPG